MSPSLKIVLFVAREWFDRSLSPTLLGPGTKVLSLTSQRKTVLVDFWKIIQQVRLAARAARQPPVWPP